MADIILPQLGEGIDKATVAYWHCQVGDRIKQGDDVAEVATDKATFNICAEADGTIGQICAQVGDEVAVGATLAVVRT